MTVKANNMKYFFRGFTKKAEHTQQVSAIAVLKDGKILFGKRNDNGRWTNPGGHLELGEKPLDAAVRELYEETGMSFPKEDFEFKGSHKVTTPTGKKIIVNAYFLRVPHGTKTTTKEDPDAEVKRWQWLDIPLSDDIMNNLHSPKNVLLRELGLQKEAEFAPGIPEKETMVELPTIKNPCNWEFGIHLHEADRRGVHLDLRLGDPTTGHAHSWALKTTWPKPGESLDVIQQPTHTLAYMDWKGNIPAGGYGAGRVSVKERQKTEITNSQPGHISFNLYKSSGPEEYTLHRIGGNTWRLYNRTINKAKGPNIPNDKPKYKEKSLSDINFQDTNKILSAKIDGAHNLVVFPVAGQKVRVLSYRPAKRETGIIEHTHKIPGIAGVLRTMKGLKNTVLRAETFAVNPKNQKATPSEHLAGMLNSNVWKSREKQKTHGILQNALIDVVSYRGKKMENAPYKEKLKVFKEVMDKYPGVFTLPPMAHTPEEKKDLLKKIKSGKLPITREGVVEWDLHVGSSPAKIKFKDEHDVYIRKFFPGSGKYKDKAVGGFYYSHTPTGKIVGKVGTGLTDSQRKDMNANPHNYLGMVAKIKATKKMKSGALFQPSFDGFHLDKNEQTDLDRVKLAFWSGFQKKSNQRPFEYPSDVAVNGMGSFEEEPQEGAARWEQEAGVVPIKGPTQAASHPSSETVTMDATGDKYK